MITLNEGQLAASQKLTEFIHTKIDDNQIARHSNRYTCLTGGGGSGKTTSIFYTLKPFQEAGKRILMVAPTNKAVKVMTKTAKKFGLNFEAKTLASALGVAVLPNEENKKAVKVGKALLKEYDIVVCDEASLASARSLDLVEENVMFSNTKIIWMGDDYQLPPVKEVRSEAFDMGENIKLTKIERNHGRVLEFAESIRDLIDKGRKLRAVPTSPQLHDGSDVFAVMGPKFIQEAVKHIDLDNPDKCRLLAWTNRRVDEMNTAVRQHFHGKKVPQYLVGEYVVTTDAVKNEDGNIVLSVDEECIIKDVFPDMVSSPYNPALVFNTWTLIVQPVYAEGSDVILQVIQSSVESDWQDHLREIAVYARNTGDWAMYWNTRESIHSVKHCAAITIHRSQGSTFETSFLDLVDVQKNQKLQEQLRLIYVGASRPSHQLFVNRNKFIV